MQGTYSHLTHNTLHFVRMEFQHTTIDQQAAAIAADLGAEPGSHGYFKALAGGVPLLFKITSEEPFGYMFKLRMKEPHNLPCSWHENLPPEFSNADVKCEIDAEYIYLWIRNPLVVSAISIADAVRECINDHRRYFPSGSDYCFDCKSVGTAQLVQAGGSVSSVCDSCLDAREDKRKTTEEKLNESSANYAALFPLALILSSLGWASFWAAYDWAFAASGEKRIIVPIFGLLLLVAGVGVALGWPIGKLLHRSGVVKRFSPGSLSIIAGVTTLIIGELLYSAHLVYRITGSFHPGLILKNSVMIATGGSVGYTLGKLIFAGGLIVVIHHIAKPKTVSFSV